MMLGIWIEIYTTYLRPLPGSVRVGALSRGVASLNPGLISLIPLGLGATQRGARH